MLLLCHMTLPLLHKAFLTLILLIICHSCSIVFVAYLAGVILLNPCFLVELLSISSLIFPLPYIWQFHYKVISYQSSGLTILCCSLLFSGEFISNSTFIAGGKPNFRFVPSFCEALSIIGWKDYIMDNNDDICMI